MTEKRKTIEEQVQDEFALLENHEENLPYVNGESNEISFSKYQKEKKTKKILNNILNGNSYIPGEPIGGNPEDNHYSTKKDQEN